jgi:hypothetical protein
MFAAIYARIISGGCLHLPPRHRGPARAEGEVRKPAGKYRGPGSVTKTHARREKLDARVNETDYRVAIAFGAPSMRCRPPPRIRRP